MHNAHSPSRAASCCTLQHHIGFQSSCTHPRHRPGLHRGRVRVQPVQAVSPSISHTASLKQRIYATAGPKNGTDRTESQAADISKLLQQLEGSGTLEDLDLAGTEWKLLYTESKGSSSGKIGPFVGRVAQVFPRDQPGQYINKVDFGLVQADLLANYKKTARDRIQVAFEYIELKLGPLRFKKDISGGTPDTSGGFWRLAYTDDSFRVLYTNLGNVFVLMR